MRIQVIFNCRLCGSEVVREYETLDDPKFFVRSLLAGADIPPPSLSRERMVDKTVTQKDPAPADLVHECGEKCLGALKFQAALW
jgi:hypothetical protein